ncbi:hypothetical protein PV325_008649 [Microctonus aethiopoides]|nr:hypothetical protein PV325_008649 [Microctonus aethiopoides]KAK0076865.1 hypothetical protein PV326_010476 [Microctonus aethiopoides]
MVLSGDFNINFADDKNLPLIEFLNEEFGLRIYHKPIVSFLEYDDDDDDNHARIVEIVDEDDANNSNIVEINGSNVDDSDH